MAIGFVGAAAIWGTVATALDVYIGHRHHHGREASTAHRTTRCKMVPANRTAAIKQRDRSSEREAVLIGGLYGRGSVLQ